MGVPVFGPIIVIALLVLWFWRRYQRRHPRPVHPGWVPATVYAPQAPAGWYPMSSAPAPDTSIPPAQVADNADAGDGTNEPRDPNVG